MNHSDSPGGATITRLKCIMRPGDCESVTLASALNEIRSGTWRKQVEEIRSFDRAGDQQSAQKAKKRLPCFLFAGVFSYAEDNGLVSHSGLAVLDVDNLDSGKLSEVRAQASHQPWVAATFTSPRGRGLKVLCRIGEQDCESHRRTVDALRAHCSSVFGTEIDHGADVSRKCFVSFDSELDLRPDSAIWSPSGFCDFTQEHRNSGTQGNMSSLVALSLAGSTLGCPTRGRHEWPSTETIVGLIQEYHLVPKREHDTHKPLLKLARLALTLRKRLGRKLTQNELEAMFNCWHGLTYQQDPAFVWREYAEYWHEFATLAVTVKVPLDENPVDHAWRLSLERPLPSAALSGPYAQSPRIQRLIALCCELANANGDDKPFFLSCRDAARLIGTSWVHAATQLRGLVISGVIEEISKGTRGQNGNATEYRWIGGK